ncbi:hypothetical protein VF21_00906 [Pseudogymnoascus sp. 05NY08]|nr:hypothetical protein VF21_00906 [Pseudogymnoascus sp. 05NY08]
MPEPTEAPQKRQDMDTLRKNLTAETNRLATVRTAPVEKAQTQVAKMEADRAVSDAKEEEERKRKWRRWRGRWVGRMMGISAAT